MDRSSSFLSPARAAARLGVSIKALRLYEARGLIAPGRTAAGWRVYGPGDLARAAEVVGLRALGLGLAEVARVLDAQGRDRADGLAGHEARLQRQAHALAGTLDAVRRLRTPGGDGPVVAFDLPWPWAGERFELGGMAPITYLTGPLGSGKTRLAQRIAEVAPGGAFIGLDRLAEGAAAARLADDRALHQRVDAALAALVARGAQRSPALTALLVALAGRDGDVLVVDMVEAGLDPPTQVALIAWLRQQPLAKRALVLMTRSSSILDLGAIGDGEAILLCPANHSPPLWVSPWPGAPGYEAVATTVAAPEVRARTAGVLAVRVEGA